MGMQDIFDAAMNTPGHVIRYEGKKVTKMGLNLAFEGMPGTGKTQQVREWTEMLGLHGELIISSVKDPTEFAGLPVPGPDGSMRYQPGPKIMNLIKSKRGVGILDEFNTSPQAVQAAMLTMVQDNLAGDIEIPGGIRWVVMMNPTDIAANGSDLAPPTANRFGWFKWDACNASDWATWLMGLSGDELSDKSRFNAEQREKEIIANWSKPFARARGITSGFVKANPNKLMMMPSMDDPNASRAWPSPRSWENATRALASAELHGLEQLDKELFVEAFIGKSAANEMFTYLEAADLPDPEDLLTGKVKFQLDKKRIDRMYAIFNSATAYVTASTNKKEQRTLAEALWGICEEAIERPDLIMDPSTTLVNKRLVVGPAAIRVLKKINPVLVSTGQIPGA